MTTSFASATILLLLITDPFGNIPVFAHALKNVAPGRRTLVILREVLIAFAVLLAFMFMGRGFLQIMNLSELSLQIAGGVVLFLIALRMIFPPAAGASADMYHFTAPDPEGRGAARAMRAALRKAGLGPEDVDYVNAHGTSTQLGDIAETLAIHQVLGERARTVPVSSTKSMTGHLLGAAGAIEAAACVLAMDRGLVPPTINLDHPGEGCDLDYIPNVAREARVDVVMSNSFGFGGHNASLVLGRGPSANAKGA